MMTTKKTGHLLSLVPETTERKWSPTPKQIEFLNAALECGLDRNISTICNAVSVSRQAFYGWLKTPGFAKLWDEVPRQQLKKHLPSVVSAMIKRAQGGDPSSAKLVMSAAGMLGPDVVRGDTLTQINIAATHLALIPRADNLEQFKIIQEAVRKAAAEVIDVEMSDAGEGDDDAVAASTDDTGV